MGQLMFSRHLQSPWGGFLSFTVSLSPAFTPSFPFSSPFQIPALENSSLGKPFFLILGFPGFQQLGSQILARLY